MPTHNAKRRKIKTTLHAKVGIPKGIALGRRVWEAEPPNVLHAPFLPNSLCEIAAPWYTERKNGKARLLKKGGSAMALQAGMLDSISETKYLSADNYTQYRAIMRVFYVEHQSMRYQLDKETVLARLQGDPDVRPAWAITRW